MDILSTANEWVNYCRQCDRRFNRHMQPLKLSLADILREGRANPGQQLIYEGKRLQDLCDILADVKLIFAPPGEETDRYQAELIAKLRTAKRFVLSPKGPVVGEKIGRAVGYDWHAEYA